MVGEGVIGCCGRLADRTDAGWVREKGLLRGVCALRDMGKMGVASALAKAQVLGPGILPCSWVAATLRVFYGREGTASRSLGGGVPAGMRG